MNEVSHGEVIAAVRAVALGEEPAGDARVTATALGFLAPNGSLTESGRTLVENGILRGDDSVRRNMYAEALRSQPAIRELLEGEWAREIGRDQAEAILKYVSPEARTWQSKDFTRLFESLNYARIATFNRQSRKLRIINVSPSTHLSPEGALISPDAPYRNRRLMAELVGSARRRLWWFDSHFTRQALGFLYDEARLDSTKEVRILSCGRSELNRATLDEYGRIKEELRGRGVTIEWRTLPDRDDFTNKHDRWLRADDSLWNVPPYSAVMQNKFGSLLPDPTAVPLTDWWDAGVEVDRLP